ncbi:hypothetical protein C0J52_07573 [Blattella germanica]|nr:hypothetical protein C0J52_07573 [Blattella germanica]
MYSLATIYSVLQARMASTDSRRTKFLLYSRLKLGSNETEGKFLYYFVVKQKINYFKYNAKRSVTIIIASLTCIVVNFRKKNNFIYQIRILENVEYEYNIQGCHIIKLKQTLQKACEKFNKKKL